MDTVRSWSVTLYRYDLRGIRDAPVPLYHSLLLLFVVAIYFILVTCLDVPADVGQMDTVRDEPMGHHRAPHPPLHCTYHLCQGTSSTVAEPQWSIIKGRLRLIQHLSYRGSSHRRKDAARTIIDMVWPVFWIRICFRAGPDPAFSPNAAPDPGSKTNADRAWSDFNVTKWNNN